MKSTNESNKTNLKVTWFGHSAFAFESAKGRVVLIDPWLDNPKAPASAKDIARVDLILISHGHGDHVGNAIELARRTNAQVVCIHELALYLKSKGVERVVGMNKGGTVEIEGMKVTMVHAIHSSDLDTEEKVIPGGDAAGFVVEFENGFRVYHAGDTALFGDMRLIGKLFKPDLALLPIGDLYTMGPSEAAIACEFITPKHIIGMHYGTFPVLTGTPSSLRKHLPAKMKNRVLELVPGNEITL